MTGKEKIATVLNGRTVDAFPSVIPYLGIYLRDHWDEITQVPWYAVWAGDLEANLQVEKDLYSALDIDWVALKWCWTRARRERHSIECERDKVFLVNHDAGTRTEITRPPVGGEVNVLKCRVFNRDDADRLVPELSSDVLAADGSLDLARALVETYGNGRYIFGSVGSPFWGAYSFLGFEDLMINLLQGQELLEYLIGRVTEAALARIDAFAGCGADGIWIEDCYSSRDIISLEHFRRFARPAVQRLVDRCRHHGLKSIYYFCGDVSDRVEDLIEIGPDALSFEESKKGFRIELSEIDEQVNGRTCLLGNIDAIGVLQKGSSGEIRAALEQQVGVGRRSGQFILSLGSPVTPLTSTEKLQEYLALARDCAPGANSPERTC